MSEARPQAGTASPVPSSAAGDPSRPVAADPLPLAQALIRCRSYAAPDGTPEDAGALAVLEAALAPLGFRCERVRFGATENLWARRDPPAGAGNRGPHLCFAGHTDVVPPGDLAAWRHDPFGAEVRDGVLYGRGAVDMKGGVAAWVAAVAGLLAEQPDLPGTLSLLITGDEEGPALDGTVKVLEWLAERGGIPDLCLVGEPTSRVRLGDIVKVGRRGSLNAVLTVHGKQGHVAYPQRADNPVHRLLRVLHGLTATPLDAGNDWFEPSSLQVTSIDVGNPSTNVIPATAQARLNIRFNDGHTGAGLAGMLRRALEAEGEGHGLEVKISGEAFLTEPGPFVEALRRAVRRATGEETALDTGGGTSDARFIARYCPVAELGSVGSTMHQVDERVPVAELRGLAALYRAVIDEVMGTGHGSMGPGAGTRA
ncbi:succinyl-diaminopimelate desuccinylase [Roseomonas sp. NAR14]|uniref:Succinyl-diaminopimelate desuccinylase n=1 Tax=Roseomonas acroporae TaxID=2937791 RepID=A0A9X1YAZ9_9PROT|nr:succinyl-diaminopimelate desuccinylase [Roseomonas acroporae]MCK8787429.1 succinyl-diaminopimelate desuccinylase [Roseomonas acroporae]